MSEKSDPWDQVEQVVGKLVRGLRDIAEAVETVVKDALSQKPTPPDPIPQPPATPTAAMAIYVDTSGSVSVDTDYIDRVQSLRVTFTVEDADWFTWDQGGVYSFLIEELHIPFPNMWRKGGTGALSIPVEHALKHGYKYFMIVSDRHVAQ